MGHVIRTSRETLLAQLSLAIHFLGLREKLIGCHKGAFVSRALRDFRPKSVTEFQTDMRNAHVKFHPNHTLVFRKIFAKTLNKIPKRPTVLSPLLQRRERRRTI